jgi:hypothetical protein
MRDDVQAARPWDDPADGVRIVNAASAGAALRLGSAERR